MRYSDLSSFCFSTLQVFCSFCALVMFLCFSDLPLLCLPSCFFGHFCLETYVRVTMFSCACDHVFTHFVTVIVRLGTGVVCKCTCVKEILCEPILTEANPDCKRGYTFIRGEKRNHLSEVGLFIFYSLTT